MNFTLKLFATYATVFAVLLGCCSSAALVERKPPLSEKELNKKFDELVSIIKYMEEMFSEVGTEDLAKLTRSLIIQYDLDVNPTHFIEALKRRKDWDFNAKVEVGPYSETLLDTAITMQNIRAFEALKNAGVDVSDLDESSLMNLFISSEDFGRQFLKTIPDNKINGMVKRAVFLSPPFSEHMKMLLERCSDLNVLEQAYRECLQFRLNDFGGLIMARINELK